MPEDTPSRESEQTRAIGTEPTHVMGSDPQPVQSDGSLPPATHIGPYRLIRELGKGGMGTVYLASRTDVEFHKEVALKVVKAERDRPEIVGRFHRERRILSSLAHPNIARLLDGGTADDGRPYIVMEYVRGLPIHEHCDENRLTTTERLTLFRQVCDAVQYAHRNLIVHRDLKPRNVLVTAGGTPMLLDFGIAKLLNAEQWGDIDHTNTRVTPLTPQFASPEQVRGEPITTATDVYSLGVMLYLLLTRRLPYRLTSSQPFDVLRAVTEQDPERPSLAVTRRSSDHDADTRTLSRVRGGKGDKLSLRLQGDLDIILLKALRKEPDRRYRSVEALSEDLRRHLEGLPVRARTGSFAYRASKFVRRHRAPVAAAAASAIALLGLTGLSLRERSRAQAEAAKSKAVVAFLEETLSAAAPFTGSSYELTVVEALDRAAESVNTSLADQPLVKAAVQNTIGATLRELSRHTEAEKLLRSALEIRRRELGDHHPDVAESLNALGRLARETDRSEEAEALHREALAIRRAQLGRHPDVAESLNQLQATLFVRGAHEEAESLGREALEMWRRLPGDHGRRVAQSLMGLGTLLREQGDYAAAEAPLREALSLAREVHGADHPYVAQNLSALGELLSKRGDYAAAEPFHAESLRLSESRLPDHVLADELNRAHFVPAVVRIRYGHCLTMLGRYREAEELLLAGHPVLHAQMGPRHADTRLAAQRLAELYEAWRQPEKAAGYRALLEGPDVDTPGTAPLAE